MDALVDKIFTLGVFMTMLVLDILPRSSLFSVLLIVSREFTITGLRAIAASKNASSPHKAKGKSRQHYR
jgi:CDP-diacylglycerol--glycerol-3-phosphate 3-phosphatidyltransferase